VANSRIRATDPAEKKLQGVCRLHGGHRCWENFPHQCTPRHEWAFAIQQRAGCTAVVTEVSWNASDDEAQRFRARIDYITKAEWKAELDFLYNDLNNSISDDDNSEGEEYADEAMDRHNRITATLSKIRHVYPHISEDQIRTMPTEELLVDSNVYEPLGTAKIIKERGLDTFRSKIKRYIGSSTFRGENAKRFAQWPLVKLVRIAVKAKILKNGSVLVDLPRCLDTNAPRSAIAENHSKKLSITCVVANVKRAANDQVAKSILTTERERKLKLDGNFNKSSCCILESCIDGIEWKNYRNEHPEIFEDMGEELEINAELAAATRQLGFDFGLAEKALKYNQRDLKRIESDLTYLNKTWFPERGKEED
jgi:hypothetical protein